MSQPHYVGSSGGKDSTALLLRLAELGEEVQPVITPTGDELPEMEAHWAYLEQLTGKKFIRVPAPTLMDLIERFQALPNWRQRWCTRMIKIVPFEKFIANNNPCTVSIGLRADEPDELRAGMEIKGLPGVTQRWPLREWGWSVVQVTGYLHKRGIKIPARTDCGCCFFQRLYEWHDLWRLHPDRWAQYEALEERIGHTFRSPGRDTWPASMRGLREKFEQGLAPLRRGAKEVCRACSL